MKKIKNLLFDLGNVIIDIAPEKTSQALRSLLDVEYDLFADPLPSVFYDFETGRVSEEQFVHELIDRYSVKNIQPQRIIDAWNAMLIDIPLRRLKMLKALSEDFEVFILSNTNAIHIQWVENFLGKHYGHRDWNAWGIKKAYYSHELDSRKPENQCFLSVLEDAKIQASETLFIDDHPINVEKASKLGLHGHIHPSDKEITDKISTYLKSAFNETR